MTTKKPVVLYAEQGLYPDLTVETPIFGPSVELRLVPVAQWADLSAADKEDCNGLMVFRYRVTKEDMDLFPNLKGWAH